MFDYLGSYNLSKEERERLLIMVLKRIRNIGIEPKWIKKHRNKSTWKKIEKLYGKGCDCEVIQYLEQLKLIESQGANKPYLITERGKDCCKRGWVEFKINKYDNPKYPLFISVFALIISVISSNRIWTAIKWIWNLF